MCRKKFNNYLIFIVAKLNHASVCALIRQIDTFELQISVSICQFILALAPTFVDYLF